jgi:hypothetical protein
MRKFLMWVSRKYWIRRIDRVLAAAHEKGKINGWLLHHLDAKLKYGADPRDWDDPMGTFVRKELGDIKASRMRQ